MRARTRGFLLAFDTIVQCRESTIMALSVPLWARIHGQTLVPLIGEKCDRNYPGQILAPICSPMKLLGPFNFNFKKFQLQLQLRSEVEVEVEVEFLGPKSEVEGSK